MSLIYTLLVAHFVADFICQSDWMALNKSKRWDALALHVGVYTFVVALALVPALLDSGLAFGWLMFAAVNALAHFVQDAITSRITSRLWFFRMEPGIWVQAEYAVPKHGRDLVNPLPRS